MEANVKRVREILAAPGDQYLVPFFQRHYSWRRSEWSRLWEDLERLQEDDSGTSQHFLGPLVCTPTNHVPGEVTAYQLIDGQQRLTTLTVLLTALRNRAKECGLDQLAEEIEEGYLVHKYAEKKLDRYRLLPRSGDREVLISLINDESKPETERNGLRRATQFFARRLRERTDDADAIGPALKEVFDTVRNRLSLVVITIAGENPYEIFESLNSTGLPLEQSDLIRNYLFMQVPLEEQEEFNEESWQPLEDALPTSPVQQTRFYRKYLMRDGAYSLKNASFVDFKGQHRLGDASAHERVKELCRFAAYEQWLAQPDSCGDAKLSEALKQLALVDARTAHPLVFNLLARRSANTLGDDALLGCLNDLMSFIVRRSICGESTKPYSRWFIEAIGQLVENARASLRGYLDSRGWPDDKAFIAALAEFPIYRREKSKTRLILETLERAHGHKEAVPLDSELTIEHVMPQSIGDTAKGGPWQAMLGDDWQATHDRLLHTIGNLTLTGYNPKLSNHHYDYKKKLLADSHLELNRHFASVESWNAQAISERANLIGAQLVNLWPRPEGTYKPAVQESAPRDKKRASRKELYLDYWSHLIDRIESNEPTLEAPKLVGETALSMPSGAKAHRLLVRVRVNSRLVGAGLKTTGRSRFERFDELRRASAPPRSFREIIGVKLGVGRSPRLLLSSGEQHRRPKRVANPARLADRNALDASRGHEHRAVVIGPSKGNQRRCRTRR